MTSLKKVELIVIDELGFVPLHKDAAQLMFQVISECVGLSMMCYTIFYLLYINSYTSPNLT